MGQHVVDAINDHKTFMFDKATNRVVNKRFQEETNIEEFLHIQHILDNNRITYRFDKNFDIQIIK